MSNISTTVHKFPKQTTKKVTPLDRFPLYYEEIPMSITATADSAKQEQPERIIRRQRS